MTLLNRQVSSGLLAVSVRKREPISDTIGAQGPPTTDSGLILPFPTDLAMPPPNPTDVSVTRLTVPLPLTIAVMVAMLSGLGTLFAMIYKIQSHVDDDIVHYDREKVLRGELPASTLDVYQSAEHAMDQSRSDLKWTMQNLSIRCEQASRGRIQCTFVPPQGSPPKLPKQKGP